MSFLRLTLSALEGRECIYGQDHPDTIASMIYVAIHRRDQDEQEKMAEVVARALPTVRKLAEKKQYRQGQHWRIIVTRFWNRASGSKGSQVNVKRPIVPKKVGGRNWRPCTDDKDAYSD